MNKDNKSYLYGFIAYIAWGILPFYWKILQHIDSKEVLAYRILFSSIFILLALVALRKMKETTSEIKDILHNKTKLTYMTLGAFFISMNWLLFITSVSNGNVIDASLGYYINPLVNVLVAVVILKEKITKTSILACIFAAMGVIILAINTGKFPWTAVLLAVTFSLYGLTKKKVDISSSTSLFMETFILAPFALVYLALYSSVGFLSFDLGIKSTLIGTGIVTVIPLLLFSIAAKKLSYIALGFIQYVSPTLMLISAVFLFKEVFTVAQLSGFICIWVGIGIFISGNLTKKVTIVEEESESVVQN
ncbi:MAG: EamA family transporter RarD [Clostridioides difficile]|nr:EamA family transporter RarD [Clostridioides difficile]